MWFTSLVARGTQMICLSIGIINHAEPAGTSGSRSWRCVGWDRYVCAVEGFDDKYECLGLWGKTGSILGIVHVCVCERETVWVVFGRAPSWLVVNLCELTSLKHILAPNANVSIALMHHCVSNEYMYAVYQHSTFVEFYILQLHQHRDPCLVKWRMPIEQTKVHQWISASKQQH